MSSATAIFHGVEIPEVLLAGELQNHQAASLAEARSMAGRALAVRAVLLARARELGLDPAPERNEEGQEETREEALVRAVLSEEVDVAPPSEQEIREAYEANPGSFRSPPLLEASHILIAPADGSEAARLEAREKAERVLRDLAAEPGRFARLASEYSACPSASEGGSLGQLRPGDVIQTIWDALLDIREGDTGPVPVQSQYGWHVLRLDHRSDGDRLPLDYVRPHIAMRLEARAWTLAAARYVDGLLLRSAASPGLYLTPDGQLDDGEGSIARFDGLLGSALSDMEAACEAIRPEAREQLNTAASQEGETPAAVLARTVRSFLSKADDEAWTQLISRLRDSEDPLADSLALIIAHQLPPVRGSRTLIRMRHGTTTPA